MGERIGNMNRGLFKSCFGIVMAILLGLVASLITPAGPIFASLRSKSATPTARIPSPDAAGPCIDKAKRYNDCGNGTVTDTVTGLIWLKDLTCLPDSSWEDAKKAVANLKNGDCMLSDGSSAGNWRLPTEKEWEATMEKAKELKCGGASGPVLTNDDGTACIKAGPSSFLNMEADYYWSGTPLEDTPQAVIGDLDHGNLLKGNQINRLRVWPVRDGKR